MRVCGECGASNEASEDFCGECGAYLEWDGQQVAAEQPVQEQVPEPVVEEPARGFTDRVKAAVGIGPAEAPVRPEPVDGHADRKVDEPGVQEQPAAKAGKEESTGSDPAAALLVKVPPPAPETGARRPAPVRPGAAAPKPRRRPQAKDKEPVNPGDLICGDCGAGNKPTRKFCRRCGADLAEAPVARIPWWRRVFRRRSATGPAAGSRPKQKNRRRRMPTRLLVMLLILAVGAGGFYFGRGLPIVGTAYDMVQDRVKGTERVNPTSLRASSAAPGRGARRARDGASNRFWAPAERGDGKGEFLEAEFKEPFRLVHVVIVPGVSAEDEEKYLANGRPSELKVTLTRSDGTTEVETVELEDATGPQQFNVATSDVAKVKLTIERARGIESNPRTRVAIAEVEFRARKD